MLSIFSILLAAVGKIKYLHHWRYVLVHKFNNPPQEWWIDIGRHRTDGPALIFSSGRVEYWQEGRLHRMDGPAISDNGKKFWFINGKNVTHDMIEWAKDMNIDLDNLTVNVNNTF